MKITDILIGILLGALSTYMFLMSDGYQKRIQGEKVNELACGIVNSELKPDTAFYCNEGGYVTLVYEDNCFDHDQTK